MTALALPQISVLEITVAIVLLAWIAMFLLSFAGRVDGVEPPSEPEETDDFEQMFKDRPGRER